MTFAIAAFLRPFVAFLIVLLIARPVKRYVEQKMLPGKAKRLLLTSWEI